MTPSNYLGNGMKLCGNCDTAKPLSYFHRRSINKTDGRAPWCKDCARDCAVKHSREHPNPNRAKNARVHRAANLNKERARAAVRIAIESGELTRPKECPNCSVIGIIEAHHSDYDKPLQIEWLCHRCHSVEHRHD